MVSKATKWPLSVVAALVVSAAFFGSLGSVGANSLTDRLSRRQAETEQENTTPKSLPPSTQVPTQPANNQPRLYPDLTRPANPVFPYPSIGNGAPTPFLPPFGMSQSTGPTGAQWPPMFRPTMQMQPMRPMSSAERLQSQAFTGGLGRRLLAMIGIEPSNSTSGAEGSAQAQPSEGSRQQAGSDGQMNMSEVAKALQNSTVLQQLNRGVQSIYGSMSKMYNSTIQQQLDMLQEKFRRESENSTNTWQQRMAQQVPAFFKSMVARVEEAQENLNRLVRQITEASNGSIPSGWQPQQPKSFFDQFLGNDGMLYDPSSGSFFGSHQFGNGNFDLGGGTGANQPATKDFGSQVMDYWHNQVQPQIGMLRATLARTWRDLTSSGAINPQLMRARNNHGNNLGSSNTNDSSEVANELVENILKEVDMNSPEYTLIEPKSDSPTNQDGASAGQQPQQQAGGMEILKSTIGSPGFQNGLTNMQREINQLWLGLTNSIQSAIANAKKTLNPRPPFGSPLSASASNNNNNQAEPDPAENEIDGKIKELSRLQKDTDAVYDTVRRQQLQQQQQQMGPTFGDRFRSFWNGIDLSGVEQLPRRVGDTMNRFGNVLGDLWNQIPERWDNFVHRNQPGPELPMNRNMASGRQTSSSTTAVPASINPPTEGSSA